MQAQAEVAIIGGGPAGYTAALYCARAGFQTVVLEQLSPGGQMATTSDVENYPGFEDGIDGFTLAEKMKSGADRAGAVTEWATVTKVELTGDDKVLHTTGGLLTAKTVVIATGALPRKLGLPEEEALVGRGVAYCATCDGMLYKGKTVAVIGGGNSAAEEALFLSKLCQTVYVVHRRDQLRATRSYLQPLQQAKNVSFVWDSAVVKLVADGVLTGIDIQNTKTHTVSRLDCDGVFIAIGRIPNTTLFAEQLPLDDYGFIPADESTQTVVPGVFAIGDVRTKALRQIVTAAADGATASHYVEQYLAK